MYVGYMEPTLNVASRDDYLEVELTPDQVLELASELLHGNAEFAKLLRERVDRDGVDWLNRWLKVEGLEVKKL